MTDKLLQNNAAWARAMLAQDTEFFAKRAGAQAPRYLIIGCSDSRLSLELITGALPGEMFVHRNIGNQIGATDLNVQSVVQYAVDVLGVKDVIVCGHSSCGALKAASGPVGNGLVEQWLSGIRDTIRENHEHLASAADRLDSLARLNVLRQVRDLASTPTVVNAWQRGRRPILHGWVYDIGNGLITPVVEGIDGPDKLPALLQARREFVSAKPDTLVSPSANA